MLWMTIHVIMILNSILHRFFINIKVQFPVNSKFLTLSMKEKYAYFLESQKQALVCLNNNRRKNCYLVINCTLQVKQCNQTIMLEFFIWSKTGKQSVFENIYKFKFHYSINKVWSLCSIFNQLLQLKIQKIKLNVLKHVLTTLGRLNYSWKNSNVIRNWIWCNKRKCDWNQLIGKGGDDMPLAVGSIIITFIQLHKNKKNYPKT